jgi:nicotinamidase-related amidase
VVKGYVDIMGQIGRLLVRGEKNWDIVDDLTPIRGEYVVDKAGKGAFGQSNLSLVLRNLDITHLVITGITTDVCVHTVMREANDYGYWCTLLKDCTAATDYDNYKSAIRQRSSAGGCRSKCKKEYLDGSQTRINLSGLLRPFLTCKMKFAFPLFL